jgi:hypothetical protein
VKNINPEIVINVARRLIDGAQQRGFTLRALGGVGVRLHCSQIDDLGASSRQVNNDIDLVGVSTEVHSIHQYFLGSGLRLNRPPHGYRRGEHREYIFKPLSAPKIELHIDVYFGSLRFNHLVPRPYFDVRAVHTLPLSQLLLSKLAIVNLTSKDIFDIGALLAEHDIGSAHSDEVIQAKDLLKAWSRGCEGWELKRTCEKSIACVRLAIEQSTYHDALKHTVLRRVKELQVLMRRGPRPLCWRIRNSIGVNLFGYKIPYYDIVRVSDSPQI